MVMPEEEKQKVMESAKFLEDKGYTKKDETYAITYSNDKVDVIISYGPYSEESIIYIKFIRENECHDVGWIAVARSGLSLPQGRLENLLFLISYLRENYNKIIDLDYCRGSDKFIHEYIKRNFGEIEIGVDIFRVNKIKQALNEIHMKEGCTLNTVYWIEAELDRLFPRDSVIQDFIAELELHEPQEGEDLINEKEVVKICWDLWKYLTEKVNY